MLLSTKYVFMIIVISICPIYEDNRYRNTESILLIFLLNKQYSSAYRVVRLRWLQSIMRGDSLVQKMKKIVLVTKVILNIH